MKTSADRIASSATLAGAALCAGLLAFPFFWMLVTALKPVEEVMLYPPRWWPSSFQWGNWAEAWGRAPFGRFYVNSIVTGLAATGLQLTCALLTAYALAVIRFPGKHALLVAILATMMIPEEMKLAPNFLLLSRLGWLDTYWALILPPAAHAFPVFVLHQQFRSLPRDLLDAARVDGAGHLRILLQVVAPMSRPVLVAVALVILLGRWNDYLWPLIVTNRPEMRTLPIGLAYLRDIEAGTPHWNLLMAGALFVIAPILVLYVFAQRHFVAGLTRGALKG